MAEKIDRADAVETSPEKDVEAGEGGANASDAGNILAGMQPSTEGKRHRAPPLLVSDRR